MARNVLDALTKKFGEAVSTGSAYGDEEAIVSRDNLVEVATFLRDQPDLAFDSPVFCTCIDRLDLGAEPEARFEVCYQLRSFRHKNRIRLKVVVGEDKPSVPTLSQLWPAFDWQERETFDMYGIEFEGHPDLRRIYMYDEFVGFPLRKDYPKDKRQPLVRRTTEE